MEKHRLHGLACQAGSNDAQYDSAGEKAQGEIKKLAAPDFTSSRATAASINPIAASWGLAAGFADLCKILNDQFHLVVRGRTSHIHALSWRGSNLKAILAGPPPDYRQRW